MKLFMVHCGFYDQELCGALYEGHINLFVAANSFDEARLQVKLLPEFKAKKMHIDGVLEISAVSGHQVQLVESIELEGRTILLSQRHRDLAPQKTETKIN